MDRFYPQTHIVWISNKTKRNKAKQKQKKNIPLRYRWMESKFFNVSSNHYLLSQLQ